MQLAIMNFLKLIVLQNMHYDVTMTHDAGCGTTTYMFWIFTQAFLLVLIHDTISEV